MFGGSVGGLAHKARWGLVWASSNELRKSSKTLQIALFPAFRGLYAAKNVSISAQIGLNTALRNSRGLQ